MFIEDVMTGAVVLEISLMSPFSVFTPWEPVFAVGGKGTVLFIKGHAADANTNTSNNGMSCFVMIHLKFSFDFIRFMGYTKS